MLVLSLTLTAILAYALGGVNGAIISSKYIFGKDIRESGSGNAGLTNAYRVYGLKGAIITFAIDTAKAAIAVAIGWLWIGGEAAKLVGPEVGSVVGKFVAGFFAMVGHAFPIWYGFKGGRGVLVCGVAALMIHPWAGICSVGVFLVVVAISRYVSLGSIVAGLVAFPLFTGIFVNHSICTGMAVACGLLIVLMHAPNISRIIRGKEPKFGAKSR
ncbi:MAG: glycerol-3-phosphate acyltransferase [Oscillospiraceae bacterium]|jgi:glycerol-3-phosphate acyltransferase PlsY|nr:glycerol-3-phosphate acyltransferase [Oscillospiraceae bacterium]